MKRFIETTGIALVLSFSALAGAHAAQLNTTPLNYLGQPVSNKPVTTAAGLQANTTTPSFYTVPRTPVTTAAGLQINTTTPSIYTVPKTPVTTAAGLQANTTTPSFYTVPKTPVTTAAGLSAITFGTFATPNIKATIATGPIPVPKQGGASINVSYAGGEGAGLAAGGNAAPAAGALSSFNAAGLIADTPDSFTNTVNALERIGQGLILATGAGVVVNAALNAAGSSPAVIFGPKPPVTGAAGEAVDVFEASAEAAELLAK
jgi:hypothetical protein